MGYVYLLQELNFDRSPTGLYKIGKTSTEVEKRMRQYRAGNARPVVELYSVEVDNEQAVETALHHYFDAYRLDSGGGDEWFDFSQINIYSVIAEMDEYEVEPIAATDGSFGDTDDSFSASSSSSYSYSSSYGDDVPWGWGIALVFGVLIAFGGIQSAQTGGQLETRAGCHMMTINAPGYPGARLRMAPSQSSEIINTIPNGIQVRACQFSENRRWRRVTVYRTDGMTDQGWVSNGFLMP